MPTSETEPVAKTEPASARFGGHSMHGRLRRVLVRRPDAAFAVDDPAAWNYTSRPDLDAAQRQHDALVAVLEGSGVEVLCHDEDQPGRADSIFVYDPVWITDGGSIVLAMGKFARQGEEEPLARRLEAAGVPILARLEGDARAEGGDLLWLAPDLLVAGLGFRTNEQGVAQLAKALGPLGVEVVGVDLPYWQGPAACLHLLGSISILDHDLAVVDERLLPVRLWSWLRERGFRLVPVPPEEVATQAPNILALAPGHGLAIDGNPVTRRRLEKAGCRIDVYPADELSLKAEGGPTCLTRPVLRDGTIGSGAASTTS